MKLFSTFAPDVSTPSLARLTGLLCILITAYLLYQPGLSDFLILDDRAHLTPFLDSEAESRPYSMDILLSNAGPLKRPVAMGSFFLDRYVFGNGASAWKHTNLFIHLSVGLAIFLFLSVLNQHLKHGNHEIYPWMPLIVAAIWLVHPLHVSTTLYTIQRMTLLASLFTLLGLIAYAAARFPDSNGRRGDSILLFSAYGIFFPLAVLSKETGALFPIYCLVLEFTILRYRWTDARSSKAKLALTLGFPVILLLVYCAILAIKWNAWVSVPYLARDFDLATRLLTELRAVMYYLAMTLTPIQTQLGFVHDDFPLSTSLTSPVTTLVSACGIIFLVIVALRANSRFPMVSFGILFFLSSHLLESTVLPLELVFEHRAYIGSLGILLVLVVLVSSVVSSKVLLYLASTAALLLAIALTHLRVDTWSSEERLVNYMLNVHPQSPRLRQAAATLLAQRGELELSLKTLGDHDDFGTQVHRAYIYCITRSALDSEAIKSILDSHVSFISIYEALYLFDTAGLALDGKCKVDIAEFLPVFEKALSANFAGPQPKQNTMIYKAHFQYALGQQDVALETVFDASKLVPSNPMPLFLAAHWLAKTDPPQAVSVLEAAKVLASRSLLNYSDYINDLEQQLAGP